MVGLERTLMLELAELSVSVSDMGLRIKKDSR
jgi:hypothetical protein